MTTSSAAALKQTPANRIAQSRGALKAALLELLEERPFDQIAITEITVRANVGYATFFRHYESKEELLNDLAAAEIAALFSMAIPIYMQRNCRESSRALCGYVYEHRTLWRALLTGGAADIVRAEFVRQGQSWSRKGQKPKKTRLPFDLAVICSSGATIDALAWWLSQSRPCAVDQMAALASELILSFYQDK